MSRGRKQYSQEIIDSVEVDFRSGLFSNVEIARKHDIDDQTVGNWARKYSWKKDLASAVKKRVNDKLSGSDSEDDPILAIDNVADEIVKVVTWHKISSKKARKIYDMLTDRIEQIIIDNKMEFVAPDGTKYETEPPLEHLSKILKCLVESLAKIVEIERKSYRLDEPEDKDSFSGLSDAQIDEELKKLEAK